MAWQLQDSVPASLAHEFADVPAPANTYAGGPLLNFSGTTGRTVASVAALPLGGAVALAAPVALVSNQAIPLAGSVVLADGIQVNHTAALPLAGSGTMGVLVTQNNTQALPLGGVVEFASDAVAETPSVPVGGAGGGWRKHVRDFAPTPRTLGSRARLPLRATTAFSVERIVYAHRLARSNARLPLGGGIAVDTHARQWAVAQEENELVAVLEGLDAWDQ